MLAEDTTLRAKLEQLDIGRGLLETVADARGAASIATAPEIPVLAITDAVIHAAISHTFTPEEVGAAADRDALLSHSAVVMIDGRRRLRMTDEAQARVIDTSYRTDRFRQVLREKYEEDRRGFDDISADDIPRASAWLRGFLVGEYGDIATAPPREIRSATAARECLSLVTDLPHRIPDLAQCRAFLERSEILEPLRILIGATGGWDGRRGEDRFAGRAAELAMLRAFVDELASATYIEAATRGLTRATQTVRNAIGAAGEGPLVIAAGGGLGKSTLVAKFVLDHALAPDRTFPFAYLDFDCAALQPREPHQLLLETARQVAVFSPSVATDIAQLDRSTNDVFDAFRAIIQRITMGKRAFLLVLDTMEVVQSDPDALSGVLAFVDKLIGNGFPELRLVAAGRAEIPELLRATDHRREGRLHQLTPLSLADGRDMANRLGSTLMGDGWNKTWARRIVGSASLHREPLTIRVAVEFLRDAEDRDALAREIETMREKTPGADFVGRLYERRVLSHVRDSKAAKLAWPGLIVRNLTLDIAQRVLAPLCGLEPDEVPAAFNALAREVWIVQREDDNVLRHRPELRQRTLPLMRLHDEALFSRIAAAVAEYYRGPAAQSDIHRAEWIYYRLLGDEAPADVDQDWVDGLETRLADVARDFDPGSAAAAYLKARTAKRLLPREAIRRLPIALAWDHVARTGASLRRFDDERIRPVVLDLVARDAELGPEPGLRVEARAARDILLIKTGCWSRIARLPQSATDGDVWFAALYLAARILPGAATTPFEIDDSDITRVVSVVTRGVSPLASHESWPAIAEALAAARRHAPRVAFALERLVEETSPTMVLRRGDLGVLAARTAVIFNDRAALKFAEGWATHRMSANRGVDGSVSLAELAILLAARVIDADAVLQVAGSSVPGLTREALKSPERAGPLRITLPSIVEAADEALRKLADNARESRDARTMLRRFAAARHEDWIVPIGYAAARALDLGAIPAAVTKRLESQAPSQTFWNRLRGANAPVTSERHRGDAIAIARLADEASDLLGTAALFAEHATNAEAAIDLRLLIRSLEGWRQTISQMIAGEEQQA